MIIISKVISYFAMVGAREGKKDSAKVTKTWSIDSFFCQIIKLNEDVNYQIERTCKKKQQTRCLS